MGPNSNSWRFIFWGRIVSHFEDWPERLDDSEVESEGSSLSSDEELKFDTELYNRHQQMRAEANAAKAKNIAFQ